MAALPVIPEATEQEVVVGTSLWKDAYKRLKKNRLAVVGFVVVCIIVVAFVSVIGAVITPDRTKIEAGPPKVS